MQPEQPYSRLPELLRVPDLMTALGLSAGGVRALITRGELPAAKIGRQWIVRRDALLARLGCLERKRRGKLDPGEMLRHMMGPRVRSRRLSRSEMDQLFRAARTTTPEGAGSSSPPRLAE